MVAEPTEAEQARRLAEIQRRQTWRRDGYLSTVAWVGHRFRTGFGAAMRRVREASSLEDMPWPTGARPWTDPKRSRTRSGDGRCAACTCPPPLYLSPTLDGMVRVDGTLDPETGQSVISALDAVMDGEGHRGGTEDLRISAQRPADALGEVCRRYLDGSERPLVAGERPHVTVTVGVDALRGRSWAPCEFDDVGPVHPEVARRWACDASVARVITRGVSEPLDVGRRTPVVPASMRRAVVLRDRHCRFPGCDRPPRWCDAHHVLHWADGGATALSNLVLLCRRHHRLVHERFRVVIVDGLPVFRRPDGTLLEDRAPPWGGAPVESSVRT